MPRGKSISTEDVLNLLEVYVLDNPGVAVNIHDFGDYVRSKGYNVADYSIRRYKDLRKRIDELNSASIKQAENDVVNYHSLDVDAFLAKHHSKSSLKEALVVRDQYYRDISEKAAKAIEKRKKVVAEIEKLKATVKELETQLSDALAKTEVKQQTENNKDKAIVALRRILLNSVYPAVADSLLAKEGVLDIVVSALNNNLIDMKAIDGNTDIAAKLDDDDVAETVESSALVSQYDSINSLLGGFDE